MNKQYTLYLDESETHRYDPVTKHNKDFHFCMAGIIIENSKIGNLDTSVQQLKKIIWNDLANPTEVVLHQMRILDAERGRLDTAKYPEYTRFSKASTRKAFYKELKKIFVANDIKIIGSSINTSNLKVFYGASGKNSLDQYLVAMQLLLENYCHFLCTEDAMGGIIYEYRELIGNERLRDRYYHMKLMGSMYASKATAEKRLLGIDFEEKNNNISGLQVADFVPNAFARDHAGINQAKFNIFSTLKYHLYDGNQGQPKRYGIKYMP